MYIEYFFTYLVHFRCPSTLAQSAQGSQTPPTWGSQHFPIPGRAGCWTQPVASIDGSYIQPERNRNDAIDQIGIKLYWIWCTMAYQKFDYLGSKMWSQHTHTIVSNNAVPVPWRALPFLAPWRPSAETPYHAKSSQTQHCSPSHCIFREMVSIYSSQQ